MPEPTTQPEPTAPAPAVSPTGTPLLPPSLARWVTIGVVAALAGLGATAVAYPDVRWIQIALAVVTAVGAVLGIASPGLRRAALVLLCLSPVALSSCETVRASGQRISQRTLDCAISEIASGAASALPAVRDALAGSTSDWQGQLDGIAVRAGFDVVVCAVRAVLAEFEAAPVPGSDAWAHAYLAGGQRSTEVRYARAQAYLRANGL